MDSFNFQHDLRVEKANAISRYHRIQRITTLFRFLLPFVFLIIISRFSTDRFAFPLKPSGENFRGVSVTLISPRFVFLLGNVIAIVLFLRSGRFFSKDGDKVAGFYEEYAEKCRKCPPACSEGRRRASDAYGYTHGASNDGRKTHRSHSQNLERVAHGADLRRELRRSVTEGYHRKGADGGKKAASENFFYPENEMSSEEFRRKVEAFIGRQQRFLREEGELPGVVFQQLNLESNP